MPTQAAVARHLALNGSREVRDLRDRGVIPDPKTATLEEIREAYIRHLREVAAGRGLASGSDEKQRLLRAQAVEKERQNLEAAGELIRREDVVATWSERITACKTLLRSIPKRMRTRQTGFTAKMATRMLREIDEALRELAGEGTPRKRRRRKRKPGMG